MKGGALRGQGTYGCVFQPALLCRGSKNPTDPNKVGKITDYADAKNELRIAKYIRTIPGYQNYVIISEAGSCTPRAKSKQVDPDIEKCRFSEDLHLNTVVQLIMPYGGLPLSRINLDPSNFDFFRFMEDILSIGTFLVLNDICHFDFWGQNILFDRTNKPRLIDFGFTFQPSKIVSSDLYLRWRELAYDYDTEPPEVTLMHASQQNIPVDEAIRQLKLNLPALHNLTILCEVSPDKWASQLKGWSSMSQSFQQRDWFSCWKTYWPGFDAWSIGAVLLSVLETQMRFNAFQSSRAWLEKGNLIKKILKGMCHPHPAYRYDAVEALNFLTKGTHPLISSVNVFVGSESTDEPLSGQEWIQEKKARRQLLS
jgi:serine/threonine protein kinase